MIYRNSIFFLAPLILLFCTSVSARPLQSQLNQALTKAIIGGDTAKTKSLLRQGAQVNTPARVMDLTPLMWASLTHKNYSKIATLLIAKGAEVNANATGYFDMTPLMILALNSPTGGASPISREIDEHESVRNADILLKAGANINALDAHGQTALADAVQSENAPLAHFLLAHGVRKETKDQDGNTVLIEACQDGSSTMATLLIDAGANVNTQNNEGTTPLMAAVTEGFDRDPAMIVVIKLLLKKGADPNKKDDEGRTAIFLIRDSTEAKRSGLVDLLRQAGAKAD